jgi:serine O-acetyltransferase
MKEPAFALRAGTPDLLGRYVATQLGSLFPAEGFNIDLERLMSILPGALDRLRPILATVRNFDPGLFNHFNALQYASFLYLLGNEQWRANGADALADRLFCLNRALNAVDLFYAVNMPEVFFLSHALGTVLGNAEYGDRLVVFQNVTVGRVGDDRPRIGSNVVLYPGAMVTGKAVIGNNCVIAAGTVVHGHQIPDDSVATTGATGLVLKPRQRDFSGLYLRDTGIDGLQCP